MKQRYLEIGPGDERIEGFETLNIFRGPGVDHVCDASKPLPFKDNAFDLIYASHVLEHIVWYQTEAALREWIRILKPGGVLEVWVPDGLKICQTLLNYELNGISDIDKDGWYRLNPRKDPYVWVNGRIFTYGDGTGNPNHPNWHRAIFTLGYLKELFERVGFINVREMECSEVRGYDHGWINLGVKGTKP
jgi:SAM-dependent methyltransferase